MMTALRSSPYSDELAYCKPVVERANSRSCAFTIKSDSEPLHASEISCWLSLFCGATIAKNFPIPTRHSEVGLEIPLHILASLISAQHFAEYEGGVVLKGFSSLLVPVKRLNNCVQWHLLRSEDSSTRISYNEASRNCPNRMLCEDLNLESLPSTRAFVGWCDPVISQLATSRSEYSNIDYSGTCETGYLLRVSEATVGFQQGGSAQLSLAADQKDSRFRFPSKDDPYRMKVDTAEKLTIALYDTSDQRAWLAPASDVLLHMAKCYVHLALQKGSDGLLQESIPDRGELSSKQILLRGASIELYEHESFTLKELVQKHWSLLEICIDQGLKREQKPGVPIQGYQETVNGFEFLDIVEHRMEACHKKHSILKSCGGWPKLIHDIGAPVLFASGYGDVLLPSEYAGSQGICRRWRRVPRSKDYLASTVRTMLDIFHVAGSRLDRKYLTSTRLCWHRDHSTSLFEPCQVPRSYNCACVRLQRIVPESAIGSINPPGELLEGGAIIIGQDESPFSKIFSNCATQEREGLYSRPNDHIQSSDVEVKQHTGPNSSTTSSESESYLQDKSDTTDATRASLGVSLYEDCVTSPTELHMQADRTAQQRPKKRSLSQDRVPVETAQMQQCLPVLEGERKIRRCDTPSGKNLGHKALGSCLPAQDMTVHIPANGRKVTSKGNSEGDQSRRQVLVAKSRSGGYSSQNATA